MKQLHMIVALACASMFLASCSEEQTQFDINNLPYRTNVQGKVVYNQGTTIENGKFVYDYQPASDLEVFLVVDNDQYDSSLSGNTVMTTTTDAEGNYSFEVPVGLNGATATIKSAQFVSTTTKVVCENNQIASRKETVVYGFSKTVSLKPQGYTYSNIECQGIEVTASPETLSNYATIRGQINQNTEVYVAPEKQYNDDKEFLGYQNAKVLKAFKAASNVNAIITVDYASYATAQSFNVTTNAEGYFELSVPIANFPAYFNYTIDILPVQNATYTHYVPKDVEYEKTYGEYTYISTYRDYDAIKLDGYYTQTSWTNGSYNADYAVSSILSYVFKGLVFNPFTDNQDIQGYDANNFTASTPLASELEE